MQRFEMAEILIMYTCTANHEMPPSLAFPRGIAV